MTFDPYPRDHVRDTLGGAGPAQSARWSHEIRGWVVGRYDEAVLVLGSVDFAAYDLHERVALISARSRRPLPYLNLFLKAFLPFLGSPDHVVLRRLLSRVLNGQSLSALAPRVESIADEILRSNLPEGGSLDVTRDFAELLPTKVMAHVLNLSEAERLRFREYTYGLMAVFNRGCPLSIYQECDSRLREGVEFVIELLRRRRGAMSDCADSVDALLRLSIFADEIGLGEETAAANALFLYLAGVDQTSAVISSALFTLMRHPKETAKLRSGEVAWSTALEELLRYESTVPQTIRIARNDYTLGDAAIRAGDLVVVLLGVANRDPSVFSDPDRLDLGRKGPAHLTFSDGAHGCIGAGFARLELRVALDRLLRSNPIEVTTEPVEYWPRDATRRLRRLEVKFA